MLRGGYVYEDGTADGSTVLLGPTAGFTVEYLFQMKLLLGLIIHLEIQIHLDFYLSLGVRIDL